MHRNLKRWETPRKYVSVCSNEYVTQWSWDKISSQVQSSILLVHNLCRDKMHLMNLSKTIKAKYWVIEFWCSMNMNTSYSMKTALEFFAKSTSSLSKNVWLGTLFFTNSLKKFVFTAEGLHFLHLQPLQKIISVEIPYPWRFPLFFPSTLRNTRAKHHFSLPWRMPRSSKEIEYGH